MTPRLLVLFAALCLAADGAEKDDLKALQGTWIGISLQRDGGPAADVERGKVAFHFNGDKLSFLIGDAEQLMTVRLDQSKSPRQIVLVDNKPSVGIYELKDGKLRVCLLIKEDGKYPTEFTGGKGHTLINFRRAKDGEVPAKPAK